MDMHNVDPSNMFAQILQACSLDQCDMLPRLHPLYTRAIKLCSITPMATKVHMIVRSFVVLTWMHVLK